MRKKAIKQIGILTVCLDIALTLLDYFVKVGLQPTAIQTFDLVQGVILNLLMVLYFATSRRVKYACTRPLHTTDHVVEVKDSVLIS